MKQSEQDSGRATSGDKSAVSKQTFEDTNRGKEHSEETDEGKDTGKNAKRTIKMKEPDGKHHEMKKAYDETHSESDPSPANLTGLQNAPYGVSNSAKTSSVRPRIAIGPGDSRSAPPLEGATSERGTMNKSQGITMKHHESKEMRKALFDGCMQKGMKEEDAKELSGYSKDDDDDGDDKLKKGVELHGKLKEIVDVMKKGTHNMTAEQFLTTVNEAANELHGQNDILRKGIDQFHTTHDARLKQLEQSHVVLADLLGEVLTVLKSGNDSIVAQNEMIKGLKIEPPKVEVKTESTEDELKKGLSGKDNQAVGDTKAKVEIEDAPLDDNGKPADNVGAKDFDFTDAVAVMDGINNLRKGHGLNADEMGRTRRALALIEGYQPVSEAVDALGPDLAKRLK